MNKFSLPSPLLSLSLSLSSFLFLSMSTSFASSLISDQKFFWVGRIIKTSITNLVSFSSSRYFLSSSFFLSLFFFFLSFFFFLVWKFFPSKRKELLGAFEPLWKETHFSARLLLFEEKSYREKAREKSGRKKEKARKKEKVRKRVEEELQIFLLTNCSSSSCCFNQETVVSLPVALSPVPIRQKVGKKERERKEWTETKKKQKKQLEKQEREREREKERGKRGRERGNRCLVSNNNCCYCLYQFDNCIPFPSSLTFDFSLSLSHSFSISSLFLSLSLFLSFHLVENRTDWRERGVKMSDWSCQSFSARPSGGRKNGMNGYKGRKNISPERSREEGESEKEREKKKKVWMSLRAEACCKHLQSFETSNFVLLELCRNWKRKWTMNTECTLSPSKLKRKRARKLRRKRQRAWEESYRHNK